MIACVSTNSKNSNGVCNISTVVDEPGAKVAKLSMEHGVYR